MLIGKLTNTVVFAFRFCVVVALAAMCSSIAFAQTPVPRQTPAPGAPPSTSQTEERTGQRADKSLQTGATDAQPDLSITARVTARELRFEKVPNPTVEFTGRPRRATVWEAERENLPDEVQPGVTYRNIGITLRITSVFADIDRIVAEALGEIPLSDDAPPQSATPESPAAPLPATTQAAGATANPAPHSDVQSITASNSFPAAPHAARTIQRTRPARKGRSN